MFKWLFKKKEDNGLKDLIKVLKDGITINVNISGNINEQERGNSLEKRAESKIYAHTAKIEQDTERTGTKKIINEIPDLSKLKAPKVVFGEEG